MIWKLIARICAIPAVADWIIKRSFRTPYSHITDPKSGDMYMGRWWLFNPYPGPEEQRKNRFPLSIRVNWIRRPDSDRNLHDHPWNARTIILKGGYVERRLEGNGTVHVYKRLPGDTAKINFGQYHKIESLIEPLGTWTIFITGKHRGTWGFLVDGAKVQWRKYLNKETA